MDARNGSTTAERLGRWWVTPPRPGLQRLVRPGLSRLAGNGL